MRGNHTPLAQIPSTATSLSHAHHWREFARKPFAHALEQGTAAHGAEGADWIGLPAKDRQSAGTTDEHRHPSERDHLPLCPLRVRS